MSDIWTAIGIVAVLIIVIVPWLYELAKEHR